MNKLKKFIKQVEDNACTENMEVDLSARALFLTTPCTGPFLKYSENDIKAVAKALASGNCKSGLSIDLYNNRIGNKGAKALAEAIKSPNRPSNLWLQLNDNSITAPGFDDLLDAIVEGPTTPGLRLTLNGWDRGTCAPWGNNDIYDDSAVKLAEVLVKLILSGKCPQNLHLELQWVWIDNVGAEIIAKALEYAVKNSQAKATIKLNLPEFVSAEIVGRISVALHQLSNRNNNSNAFFTSNATGGVANAPAPQVSARFK